MQGERSLFFALNAPPVTLLSARLRGHRNPPVDLRRGRRSRREMAGRHLSSHSESSELGFSFPRSRGLRVKAAILFFERRTRQVSRKSEIQDKGGRSGLKAERLKRGGGLNGWGGVQQTNPSRFFSSLLKILGAARSTTFQFPL